MNFHVITLFPESLHSYLNSSMLKRAQEHGVLQVSLYNIREYTDDKHHTTDDRPFGGGPGMVLKAEPILRACEEVFKKTAGKKTLTILLTPRGDTFTNTLAEMCATEYSDIILIAGHYEGIDARVKDALKKEHEVMEVSIGEYILTSGELPALVIIDAIARRIPAVLGNEESLEETRTAGVEVYTRPESFEWGGEEYVVPEILRSGDHAKIEEWKKKRKEV